MMKKMVIMAMIVVQVTASLTSFGLNIVLFQ